MLLECWPIAYLVCVAQTEVHDFHYPAIGRHLQQQVLHATEAAYMRNVLYI